MVITSILGKISWDKMEDAVTKNSRATHGNKSSHFHQLVKDNLHEFIDDQKLLVAAPQSTCIVCDCSGLGLRGAERNVVHLPPHLTKQRLYKRFFKERGWAVKITGNGTFKLT